ncbi:MAG: hypothetical protein ACFFBD_14240 [Candidatus Hodarchaeota archaeon]
MGLFGGFYYPLFLIVICIMVILIIWVTIIIINTYFRYYYTKKEIKKFIEDPRFIESEKGANPYHEGKYEKKRKYKLIKIIFGELWNIHDSKIKDKEPIVYKMRLDNIEEKIKKSFSFKLYSLHSICLILIFLGYRSITYTFNIVSGGFILTIENFIFKREIVVLLNHLRDLVPILSFAFIILLYSIWAIISIKAMVRSLISDIIQLELTILDKNLTTK